MNGFLRTSLAVGLIAVAQHAVVAMPRQSQTPPPPSSGQPAPPDQNEAGGLVFLDQQASLPPQQPAPRPRPGAQAGPAPAASPEARSQGQPAPMAQGTPGPSMAPRPDGPADVFVETTGFKNKVLDVKHRDPASLIPVLRGLASGFRGARLDPSRDFRTLTVRDFPENIAAIEDALQRLDVPLPVRPDIELRLHVLMASNSGSAGNAALPDELKPVVAQLQSTFTFKQFSVLSSVVQRARDGADRVTGQGICNEEPNAPGRNFSNYEYLVRSVSVNDDAGGSARINLDAFDFRIHGNIGEATVNTSFSLKPGEKVVVGTANVRGGALILVLTASLAK